MRGDVIYVSEAPISKAKINALLRNAELSAEFAQQGQPYLCRIDLIEAPNTVSGFAWWRGRGPPYPVTTGTRARISILVDERAPITLLLPTLAALFRT
jgi:HlyD family secretion protein